jgi:hypothetical protein
LNIDWFNDRDLHSLFLILARTKQWSEKFKVIDSITRREAHEARLASLENENFIVEKEHVLNGDDDDEYTPFETSNEG